MTAPPCPRCAHPLVRVRRLEHQVLACTACAGVWMSGATLDHFVEALQARPDDVDRLEHVGRDALFDFSVDPDTVRCPVCAQTMEAVHERGGVTLDVCSLHGVWFDRDELARVVSGEAGAATARVARRQVKSPSTDYQEVGEGVVDSVAAVAEGAVLADVDLGEVLWLAETSLHAAGAVLEVLGSLASGTLELVFEVLSSIDPS